MLKAAFALFRERGYSGTSTLEIATRAKVSKRDLYALFDDKQAMLTACITERARRMRQPVDLAASIPQSRAEVAATLVALGTSILRGICDPNVLAVYRLAVAEADHAPEVARVLDAGGREANWQAISEWIAKVQARGLIGAGDPAAITARFVPMLWGDLMIRLLLRVCEPPTPAEIEVRAQAAADALLTLYPPSRPAG
ncbi:MAG TPA: TetR/AcrR family transcriptional regulator [Xanthobacteraceae bacterium]|nr:TetR/AcrR family transcriptional regulator [Xanthobacteraceae bacterium]